MSDLFFPNHQSVVRPDGERQLQRLGPDIEEYLGMTAVLMVDLDALRAALAVVNCHELDGRIPGITMTLLDLMSESNDFRKVRMLHQLGVDSSGRRRLTRAGFRKVREDDFFIEDALRQRAEGLYDIAVAILPFILTSGGGNPRSHDFMPDPENTGSPRGPNARVGYQSVGGWSAAKSGRLQ